MPDELGKQVKNDCMLLQNHSVEELFRLRQGRGDLTSLHKLAHHPAYFILKQYARRGAPVGLKTAPWTSGRKDAAIARGPYKSAYDFQDFLRTELLDMVRKHTWMVLPYRVVRHLKNLRVSPIGVVPQHERRPRPIVDYSFSKVNGETITLAPDDAMQFGMLVLALFDHYFSSSLSVLLKSCGNKFVDFLDEIQRINTDSDSFEDQFQK
jgi:hypothetical protein